MANVSAYAEKFLLDYINLGSTATRPQTWGLALSTAVPNATTFTEVGTSSGYVASAVTFQAAATPAGTASNTAPVTFGPFSSACTISGVGVKDTTATAGNLLWYGTLATARTLGIGDSLVFATGSLVTSLS